MRVIQRGTFVFVTALMAVSLAAPRAQARRATETVLHSFTCCTDGAEPWAGLVADSAGNLYGTTHIGGAQDFGTVFKVTPGGAESVLYSFCSKAGCVDGGHPYYGTLLLDGAGNLYGTAADNGAHEHGVVFKVAPDGTETVLHDFCSKAKCADGSIPYGGLIADRAGNLFGTTTEGGTYNEGVVFKLTPRGKETVLYSFCSKTFSCLDGSGPVGNLVADNAGNLYGTTLYGGKGTRGVAFKLTPDGKETVLHAFCSKRNCVDGESLFAGLISDGAGNLYGSTIYGGRTGGGVIFKITPDGEETELYSFCSKHNCPRGAYPKQLILDGAGNLYGTAIAGGEANAGTVFVLAPDGHLTVLHSFCSELDCADGMSPTGGLIADGAGNLFGTTDQGGVGNAGTVFKISLPSHR